MKLVGYQKKKRLNVLIDSLSIHNSLDLLVAKQGGCLVQRIVTPKVLITIGDNMICSFMIKEFGWPMQGRGYEANVLLMPLRGCELILGIERLNIMRVIKWDFPNRTVEFVRKGETVLLRSYKIK